MQGNTSENKQSKSLMIPVGEIVGISVGIGVVTLGLVWASVVKWNAETREARAMEALKEGPKAAAEKQRQAAVVASVAAPRVFRSLKLSELPIGSRIDVESSWGGALARGVKLLGVKESLIDGKPVAILTVQDSAGDRRELTPILLDVMSRLQNVTFREAV